MFDFSLPLYHSAAHGHVKSLSPGDIVAFPFPITAESGGAVHLLRPYLVFDWDDRGAQKTVWLVPGIRKSSGPCGPYDIHVTDHTETSTAGLAGPTRFFGT